MLNYIIAVGKTDTEDNNKEFAESGFHGQTRQGTNFHLELFGQQ